MSLNGLDDAVVTSAYQGALAEAGGWLLLKYVSRDAVEVLDRGTRGAAEARAALLRYDEKSPLYGFLLYRRRKVLIKYTPEGTSRLLLARVAVHFTAVTEKFTPHDITMTINSAEELSDAALASACSLHTAAPSSCSSSSSRRKLDEITEDAEEPIDPDDVPLARLISAAASSKASISGATDVDIPAPLKIRDPPLQQTPRESPASDPPLRRVQTAEEPRIRHSHETARAILEHDPPFEPPTADYRNSLRDYDDLFKNGPDPRLSSQTARPAMSDLYAEIYAQYNKPKVKLGPRPKISLDGKRPHTSGPYGQTVGRPVSSLPAGMRIANRKPPEPIRPKSRDTSAVPSFAFPAPPPMPAFPMPPSTPTMSDSPHSSPMLPPKSPASVKSMTLPGHGNQSPRSGGSSLEKQRLMKALELRKKQMKAKQERERKSAETEVDEKIVGKDINTGHLLTVGEPEPIISVSEKETVESLPDDREMPREHAQNDFVLPMLDLEQPTPRATTVDLKTEGKIDEPQVVTVELAPDMDEPLSSDAEAHPSIEDSGIAMTNSLLENDDHHSVAEASSPFAHTHGSSCTPSTRPSSLSEGDNAPSEQALKQNVCDEATLQQLESRDGSSRFGEEEQSVQSSPTVVPESDTPVVPAAIPLPQDSPQQVSLAPAPAQEDPLMSTNRSGPTGAVPPSERDDVRAQKRSKRESSVFTPTDASLQVNEVLGKREKRASLVLTVPKRRSQVDNKENRGTMADHIQIQLNEGDEEYLSDDDSFMEELKSATVQEAKPVSVSKSPITPFFPRKPSVSESERSASGSRVGRLSPEQPSKPSSVRKISAGWPPPTVNKEDKTIAKKVSVSSGISQRIKALAEKSSRESSLSVSPVGTPDASASIVAQRKSSFFSPPPADENSLAPAGKALNRFSRASFAKLSSSTAPDRQSAVQFPPSREIRETPTAYNVKQTTEKPESVQVTARIVRDPQPLNPSLSMPTETTPLELQRSQITIDHQVSSPPSTSAKSPVKPTPSEVEPTSPRPPSSASKDPISPNPRSSSESSWRMFGRRLSESKSGSVPPRSLSAHSSESTDEKRDEKKEKKDSRTSKLFKRMSSISSMSSRKSGASKEEEASAPLPSVREPPPPVQIGDLNVQFPDTLLWKRRWAEIDASGNLVLSMSKPPNQQSKALTKRFHLTEFRTPYAPDQDQQELPNSVAFDFIDGRTMQCACETYMAQSQVLQIFREAHDAWMAYNQGS
jgi:hypothetical protein